MGWFERVVSMDGKLQSKARRDRRLIFLLSLVISAALTVMYLISPKWVASSVYCIIIIMGHALMSLLCICRVHFTDTAMRAYIVWLAVTIVCHDIGLRAMGSQAIWPAFILLADLALVIRLGRGFATGLVAVAAVWVVFSGAETVLRFGLFDVPGTVPTWYRWERLDDTFTCSHPPCPISAVTGVNETQISLIVLLIDFAATRGFADAAEREKAAMARTIETVELVAKLLAGYDVDTVAEMLQDAEAEGRLPAAMHEALEMLEQNLRAYRPYLPKSCLPAVFAGDSPRASHDFSSDSSMPVDTPSSSQVTSDVPTPRSPMGRKGLGALRGTRATVLVVNTCGALPCLEEDPRTFTSFFEMLLGTAMTAVEARRGLVESFVGDRILAAFNTSRPCLVHAAVAVGAAQQIVCAMRGTDYLSALGALSINIGAASGRVLCGDTGCAEMRRFSLLGTLPVVACGMERAARAFGLDVVCNVALQRDAEHEHTLLLVPRLVRLVKRAAPGCALITAVEAPSTDSYSQSSGAIRVYDLLVQENDGGAKEGEWMYHIGDAAKWEPYNASMRAFLSGEKVDGSALAGEHRIRACEAIRLLGSTTPLEIHV